MQISDVDKYTYQWSSFELIDIHHQSFWIFDLEATGIDFSIERVTQFGGVVFDSDSLETSTTFNQLANPFRPIPDSIVKMTGITNHIVSNAPSFEEIFPKFVNQAGNRIWVTQAGYEFDYPILFQECKRFDIKFPKVKILDTKALFPFMYPGIEAIFNTDFFSKFL